MFSLSTAAELAAIIIAGVLVDRAGRHNILSGGLLLGGAACLGCALAPEGAVATAGLAALGKFGCSSKWWQQPPCDVMTSGLAAVSYLASSALVT